MSLNKIERIGIIAPEAYRQVLGLSNIQRSFQRSFPKAEIINLEETDLKSLSNLQAYDLIVLPPSMDGEDTPYRHYLHGDAAENLAIYAHNGRIATFCSGTYAVLSRFSYIFNNGQREEYNGYVPLVDIEAHGPIRDVHRSSPVNGLRIVPVFTNAVMTGPPVNLCYDGGPVIHLDPAMMKSDMRPLAFFGDGMVSVLAQRFSGAGILVAFSSLAHIQVEDVPEKGKYGPIHRQLRETEAAHRALWSRAMNILESRNLNGNISPC